MRLKIKRLTSDAIIPKYATPGSACFDLHVAGFDPVLQAWKTGLAFEIPEGWCMKIYSRSGHGFKHGVRLANCTGVIDADYRDEVLIKLHSDRFDTPVIKINKGDRIAQAMLERVEQVEFLEVKELLDRISRGGFGSTGL
jgi:dUTP pyrophosphatase